MPDLAWIFQGTDLQHVLGLVQITTIFYSDFNHTYNFQLREEIFGAGRICKLRPSLKTLNFEGVFSECVCF